MGLWGDILTSDVRASFELFGFLCLLDFLRLQFLKSADILKLLLKLIESVLESINLKLKFFIFLFEVCMIVARFIKPLCWLNTDLAKDMLHGIVNLVFWVLLVHSLNDRGENLHRLLD